MEEARDGARAEGALHGPAPSRLPGAEGPARQTDFDPDIFLAVVKHAPLVAIDLFVRDPDGRVLLGLRTNEPARGFWFVPGGRIWKGEHLDEAFRRIVHSELGDQPLEWQDARLLGAFTHIYPTNAVGAPGVSTHYVVIACEVRVSCRFTPPLDQHAECIWVSPEHLQNDVFRADVHPNTVAYFELDG